MSAAAALEVLVDPANRMRSVVTIPEGLTVDQIVATAGQEDRLSRKQFDQVLADPDAIGLPSYAGGNAEGYLFPATYELPPNATRRVDPDDDGRPLEPGRRGRRPRPVRPRRSATPGPADDHRQPGRGRGQPRRDRGKVARVIYNRLEGDATNDLLQIDATVNYALDRDLGVALTTEDLRWTRRTTPTSTPGCPRRRSRRPVTRPSRRRRTRPAGAVGLLRDGEPAHQRDQVHRELRQFLKYKAEFKEYCQTQSDAC